MSPDNNKDNSKLGSDIDLSPQLNIALRSELLLLVTMGIKESVERLNTKLECYLPLPTTSAVDSSANRQLSSACSSSANSNLLHNSINNSIISSINPINPIGNKHVVDNNNNNSEVQISVEGNTERSSSASSFNLNLLTAPRPSNINNITDVFDNSHHRNKSYLSSAFNGIISSLLGTHVPGMYYYTINTTHYLFIRIYTR